MKSFACILVFLVALTSCQQPHKFADVVYVMDEGLPKEAIMWFNNSVTLLEERLTSSGIGDQANLTNLYGLVLFGGAQQSVRKILSGNNFELATAQVFTHNISDTLNNLTSGDNSDGYAGVYLALDVMWRAGSTRVIIFMSDRARDVLYTNITREMLIQKLVDVQVNFNAILKLNIEALIANGPPSNESLSRYPAFGITYANDTFAYYSVPNSNTIDITPQSTVLGTDENSTIVYDYGFLPQLLNDQVYNLPIPSSIWQLNYTLNTNTPDGLNFGEAFVNNKVYEIQNTNTIQVSCQTCQGNDCFYLPNGLVTYTRASDLCSSRGGQLANIGNDTELNAITAQYNDTFWIYSYKNNKGGCLVVVGNNVTSVGCDELHSALCQVPRSSLIGC